MNFTIVLEIHYTQIFASDGYTLGPLLSMGTSQLPTNVKSVPKMMSP